MTHKSNRPGHRIETLAIHAGQPPDPATGAVVTPINMSANFEYVDLEETRTEYGYARLKAPTRDALEACLAAIEGAEHGLAFSSGIAATDVILRTLAPGDHVMATHDLFGGTYGLFENVLRPRGLDFSYVDMTDLAAVEADFRPRTRLLFVETPTNPLLQIIDLTRICEAAHRRRAKVVVDNTFATPVLQRPLELGADIVLHSTTKFMGGHSDLMGGALMLDDADDHAAFKFLQYQAGAIPGAFDCWLMLRSLKTLVVRVERGCGSARRVAAFLDGHPAIAEVYYPGLADHPGHALAARQMDDFGTMIAFQPKGGKEAASRIFRAVRLFIRASSLGAVESLIVYPSSGPHIATKDTELALPPDLLRLSIGLEHVDDLIEDLDQALAAN
jgi:cystathionine gamma-synthase